MVNYPASLDALPKPTATTKRNDPGFELHQVISDQATIIEAVEAKVGVGATTPARNKALIGSGTGLSGWDTLARKNLLINGDMRVAQRAMPTTDDQYCLDRWNLLLEAANAAIPSQEVTDVPTNGSNRALKLTVGAGEDNKFGVVTFLEFQDCADLRGKVVSLQAKLKATAAITDVRMAVLEWTGTADTLTSDVVSAWGAAGTNPTLAANWAYVSSAAANLSVTTSWATYRREGIALGGSHNNLAVMIWCEDETTTVTTDILRVTDVQLEEGAVCTEVERRHFAHEILLAKRYFTKSWAPATAVGTASANGSVVLSASDNNTTKNVYCHTPFTVPMRTTPTIALYDAAGTITKITTINAAGATTDNVTPGTGAALSNSERTSVIHNGAIAGILFHYTADAEL